MIIIERKNLKYYIKDECITVCYNGFQYFSYSIYALQNRIQFYNFREELLNSNKNQYNNILDLISLAKKYSLISSGTIKPNLQNQEIIYKK